MTTKELRELDAEIARGPMGLVEVFHLSQVTQGAFYIDPHWGVVIAGKNQPLDTFHPTTDSAASMEVLKKCYDTLTSKQIITYMDDSGFYYYEAGRFHASGETLELAIALFAKRLFTK